ncbi:MAG: hypothetical protein EOO73_06870 [Myxococcales bacterium]|nr:MAG: hypothetical protein EOO73_06870 [Myxococcales bacterium]
MKTTAWLGLLLVATTAVACGDDDAAPPAAGGSSSVSGSAGAPVTEAGAPPEGGSESGGSAGSAGSAGSGGLPPVGGAADGGAGSAGSGGLPPVGGAADGGAGGEPPDTWYACQGTEQAFVRRAILGVLGRRAYSQAEVNLYVDLINAVDALDGLTEEQKLSPPGSELRHSRKLVLEALFAKPEYATTWEELYRDIIKVQRIEEQYNGGCFATALSEDPSAVAAFVRDNPPTTESPTPFSMYDVVKGSLALDDVTPIFTANLFAMMNKTYLGANALPVALELTRRRDFGAWFDAVYLHRDVVCLGCHNSEFSVTASLDPAKNRHFPLGPLLEKSLLGFSTGPATRSGFSGNDRMHAPLRYTGFVNDCDPTPYTQEEAEEWWYNPGCATPDEKVNFCLSDVICESDFPKRGDTHPWGMTAECGRFRAPDQVTVDIAEVEAQLGSVRGLRTTMWNVSPALRAGFEKLRTSGLGADEGGEVADPDKAFAYLTAMNVVERVWLQVVGTPLTIPTRFPRNAAARDQLQFLTDAFVSSGFSNRALLEAVFASPYVNMASPESGCGGPYAAPAVFDPWVIAEEDPVKRKNSAADGVVSLPARIAAQAFYKALSWQLPNASFPDLYYADGEDPALPFLAAERQFQAEVGFYLKNAEPGFNGFDFQARLGWENRFGACNKLPEVTGADFIDDLVALAASKPDSTVEEVVLALKDRMLATTTLDATLEVPALEAILEQPLSAKASTLTSPNVTLRKVCGVIASSPQFLLNGVAPADGETVPALTPAAANYPSLCTALAANAFPGVVVTCHGLDPLTVASR